jgi:hypothetical protein
MNVYGETNIYLFDVQVCLGTARTLFGASIEKGLESKCPVKSWYFWVEVVVRQVTNS